MRFNIEACTLKVQAFFSAAAEKFAALVWNTGKRACPGSAVRAPPGHKAGIGFFAAVICIGA